MDWEKERESLNNYTFWPRINVTTGFAALVILLFLCWIAYRAWFVG
jgi:hypothetical protein